MKNKAGKKSFNSNTLLLFITIALFIVLYAGGCIAYGARASHTCRPSSIY